MHSRQAAGGTPTLPEASALAADEGGSHWLCVRFAQPLASPSAAERCFFIKKNMTKENKSRLIKFLWNLASAILAAVGTALGISCAVA